MVAAALFPPAALYQRNAHDMFRRLGLKVAGHKYHGDKINNCQFRSEYGTRPDACAELWNDILQFTPGLPNSLHPCHLFWFLKFLKQYPTEHQLAGQVGASEEVVRYYVWLIGTAVRGLKARKVSARIQCKRFLLNNFLSLYCSFDCRFASPIAIQTTIISFISCPSTQSIAVFTSSVILSLPGDTLLTSSL